MFSDQHEPPLETATATPVRRANPQERAGEPTLLRDVGSTYRDGAETDLLELVAGSDDLDSLNEDLHGRARGWAQRYHLDRTRANVLRAFEFSGVQRVLEVGAGCGAMSRYLAEQCAVVDALEPVPSRSAVAAQRLRDVPGARVFTGELSDLPDEPSYDLVVVIGVLEYVGGGGADEEPYLRFLDEIRRRLLPGGNLLLAIENKLGVKYLAGSPEDHSDRPFDSVEGYPLPAPARTFDRDALAGLFRRAGFPSSTFFSAFPDYKLTRVVMSEDLMTDPSGLAARLPRFPSPDWQTARDFGANEELLWRSFVEAGQGAHHGNSFVVVGSPAADAPPLWPAGRRAAFFTTERRPGRATRTVVEHGDGGLVTVRSVLGERRDAGGPHQVVAGGPIRPGRPLLDVLARGDLDEVRTALQRWREMVEASAKEPEGVAIDLVPHNLLVDGESLTFIDDEWRSPEWTADEVVARGLFWLCERLSAVPSVWQARPTRRAVLDELAVFVGIEPTEQWVDDVVRREAVLQVELLRVGRGDDRFDAEVTRTAQEIRSLLQLPMSPRKRSLGEVVAERDQARAEAEQARREAAALREEVVRTHATLAGVVDELTAIKGTAGHRALVSAYRAVERIAPPGTRRRSAWDRLGAVAKRRRS